MVDGPDHIFVYGTLRRDARGQALSPLCRGWRFEGYGWVPGELYDFGAYPGAVPLPDDSAGGAAAPRVRGEVYEVPDASTVLPLVDRYEGCGPEDEEPYEFERERVSARTETGGAVDCWIYWYRPTPRGRRLPSGDYLERTGPPEG